jgi:hypothetical protein
MNLISNINNNYYYIYIFLAFVFFILSKLDVKILIGIIIILYISYNINENINKYNIENEKINIDNAAKLKNDINNVEQTNTDNYYVVYNKNKNLKFLLENKEFVDILKNIRFVKKFDKGKYNSIIMNMDKIMKIYIYILSDRYDLNTYFPVFEDTKNNILESLYSVFFVIPDKFKHIYGFVPYDEINKSIDMFKNKCDKMTIVLINYGNIDKKLPIINYNKYIPYEKNKELYLP